LTATAWASAFCTTARADYGESFAERLIELRTYLIAHHPFAQRLLRIAELPGPRIKVDSMIRIDAHSAPTGKMEIAEVSSCVPGARLQQAPGAPAGARLSRRPSSVPVDAAFNPGVHVYSPTLPQ
jgi:hypothetical protein